VGSTPHIHAMTDDRDYLLCTEMDEVEGTYFDPAYFLRWIEAQRVGLWMWVEWAQPMYGPGMGMYRE